MMKRRSFLKLAVAGTLLPVLGNFSQALGQATKAAAAKAGELFDAVIVSGKKGKKYEYIHNINEAKPKDPNSVKKFTKHSKQVADALKGMSSSKSILPMCAICSMYKADKKHGKDGWGKCTRVGAMGKKKGLVWKEGWCQVWAFKKSELKKMA